MSKGEDGYFRTQVELADGVYQYKFRLQTKSPKFAVDEWIEAIDPHATDVDRENQNSIVQIKDGKKLSMITFGNTMTNLCQAIASKASGSAGGYLYYGELKDRRAIPPSAAVELEYWHTKFPKRQQQARQFQAWYYRQRGIIQRLEYGYWETCLDQQRSPLHKFLDLVVDNARELMAYRSVLILPVAEYLE
jgi:hypothetical protein